MKSQQPSAVGAPPSPELERDIIHWIHLEAELLDDRRERDWIECMVSKDVIYQVPLRSTVERARGFGFSTTTFHMDETHGSLMARIRRNESPFAWAEDPPSRTRHFVSNIRVGLRDDGGLNVRSNLMLYRTRQEQTAPQIMSAERHDVLRLIEGQWRLEKRVVYLDLTAIASHNLAIIF